VDGEEEDELVAGLTKEFWMPSLHHKSLTLTITHCATFVNIHELTDCDCNLWNLLGAHFELFKNAVHKSATKKTYLSVGRHN